MNKTKIQLIYLKGKQVAGYWAVAAGFLAVAGQNLPGASTLEGFPEA